MSNFAKYVTNTCSIITAPKKDPRIQSWGIFCDALLGFEGDGLTITQKNGKVYISPNVPLPPIT
jgi:hypothetical protein